MLKSSPSLTPRALLTAPVLLTCSSLLLVTSFLVAMLPIQLVFNHPLPSVKGKVLSALITALCLVTETALLKALAYEEPVG